MPDQLTIKIMDSIVKKCSQYENTSLKRTTTNISGKAHLNDRQVKSLEDIIEPPNTDEVLLREVSSRNNIDYELLSNLLRAQRNRILLVNKKGLQSDLEKILEEYVNPGLTDVYQRNKH